MVRQSDQVSESDHLGLSSGGDDVLAQQDSVAGLSQAADL